jgi:hypothetical protein
VAPESGLVPPASAQLGKLDYFWPRANNNGDLRAIGM